MSRFAIGTAVLVAATVSAAVAETSPELVTYEGGAVAASLSGAPGNPEEGVKVMTTRSLGNCVACHQISALPKVPFQGNVGPKLDGTGTRWTEAQLRGIVANAKKTFDGTRMPAFYKTTGFVRPGNGYTAEPAPADLPPVLTAQQIEDVVAYLVTLKQ